jgi:predicted phage-related endonuclease
MSIIELESKCRKLQELKDFETEVKAEIATLENEIKAHMQERDTEELTAGQYIIRWPVVLTSRFDTTAFKRALPDMYKAYTKQTISRRFTISE